MREWEINGIVTNYAKKIIVHSFDAKRKLLEKDIAREVKQIWSFVNIKELKTTEEKCNLKAAKGYDKDSTIIAAFGHIHETKRAIPILKAISKLVRENYQIKMVFVGKLADELKKEFYEVIKESKIEKDIKVTGYVTLQEFEEYLDITDICLNLRFPYNGETSASLTRNLAKGNLVITNDIGSFGEVPDETCVKIPDVAVMTQEEEIEQIYSAMKRCLDNPVECTKICKEAEKFAAEKLDVKKAAKDYYDFIEQARVECIDEKFVKDLSEYLENTGTGIEQIHEISKTLAWLKEAQ